ncbi:hypothetical protein BDP27DRAFT_1410115 [Rhodocollybia butyracea]|uniref:Uncharacterized protein n=1 Tax=Rhodocollybia butyracea TaxID=206335 RepID=A0A9P5P5A7_9AGAR|nr:hypothetical protein BDP27DRAFT_1410115 [Rhodocollybia butyracea]
MAKLDVSGVIGSCTRFIHAAQPAPGLILAPTVPGPLSHTYLSQFFLPTSQLQQLQLVPDPTLLVFPSAPQLQPPGIFIRMYRRRRQLRHQEMEAGCVRPLQQTAHADADSNAVLTLDPSGEKGHHNPGSTLPVPNPQASEPEPTSISEFPQPESLPNPLSESHLIPSLAQIQEEVNHDIWQVKVVRMEATMGRMAEQVRINNFMRVFRAAGGIIESSEDQVAVSAPGQKTEYHAEKMTIDRYGDLREIAWAKKEEGREGERIAESRAAHNMKRLTPHEWDEHSAVPNIVLCRLGPGSEAPATAQKPRPGLVKNLSRALAPTKGRLKAGSGSGRGPSAKETCLEALSSLSSVDSTP